MNMSIPSSRDEIVQIARGDFNPGLVEINEEAIGDIEWPRGNFGPMVIGLHDIFENHADGAFAFLLLMTSINYRFWRLSAGEFDRYAYGSKTGARALWLAFESAWGEEPTSSGFKYRLAADGVEGLFGDIPDPISRAVILDELLHGDIDRVSADLVDEVRTRGEMKVGDAARLAALFPAAFGDPYLKKAQLGLSLCAGFLRHQGLTVDTSDFTAFADYQVPRVLRALGILHYGSALALAVDQRSLIAPNSAEERAIRSASVLACERIGEHLGVSAAEIDNLLWHCQQVAGVAAFHLTETTWY